MIKLSAKLEMMPVDEVIRRAGLKQNGSVQSFHTANVMRRIAKYMPYRTSTTIKITALQTDVNKPEIVTDVPYGKYLYYGVAMEGSPKKPTERPLNYTKTFNALAGPFWDKALVAGEMPALTGDLQRYINHRRRSG